MKLQNADGAKLLKDRVIKLISNITELEMNNYFEHSISAYMVLTEVYKMLDIDEIPLKSVQNGNASKIISASNKIIEAKFSEKRTRELLKYYIAHSFFEDYDLEGEVFSNELSN